MSTRIQRNGHVFVRISLSKEHRCNHCKETIAPDSTAYKCKHKCGFSRVHKGCVEEIEKNCSGASKRAKTLKKSSKTVKELKLSSRSSSAQGDEVRIQSPPSSAETSPRASKKPSLPLSWRSSKKQEGLKQLLHDPVRLYATSGEREEMSVEEALNDEVERQELIVRQARSALGGSQSTSLIHETAAEAIDAAQQEINCLRDQLRIHIEMRALEEHTGTLSPASAAAANSFRKFASSGGTSKRRTDYLQLRMENTFILASAMDQMLEFVQDRRERALNVLRDARAAHKACLERREQLWQQLKQQYDQQTRLLADREGAPERVIETLESAVSWVQLAYQQLQDNQMDNLAQQYKRVVLTRGVSSASCFQLTRKKTESSTGKRLVRDPTATEQTLSRGADDDDEDASDRDKAKRTGGSGGSNLKERKKAVSSKPSSQVFAEGVFRMMSSLSDTMDTLWKVDDFVRSTVARDLSVNSLNESSDVIEGLVEQIQEEIVNQEEAQKKREQVLRNVERSISLVTKLHACGRKEALFDDKTLSPSAEAQLRQLRAQNETVREHLGVTGTDGALEESTETREQSESDRATIDSLVDILTSADPKNSPKFQQMFLMTYRYYMPTSQLLEKLVIRYCLAPPLTAADEETEIDDEQIMEFYQNQQLPVRKRVLHVLRHWIAEYFTADFSDEHNQKLVTNFIQNTVNATGNHRDGGQLETLLQARLEQEEQRKKDRAAVVIDCSPSDESRAFSVFEMTPFEFAAELTLYEFALFKSVTWMELIQQRWAKPDKAEKAPALVRYTEHFNRVGKWVVQCVVTEPKLKRRAALVRRFIVIAMQLYRLKNYGGLFEIIAGLDNTPVRRLRQTWADVGHDLFVVKEQLAALMKDNFVHYRRDLRQTEPPCLPYPGMFLKDLTFLEDGNSTFVGEGAFVNCFKFRRICEVINRVLYYQKYEFDALADVKQRLTDVIGRLPTLDDKEAYQMSLDLEPMGSRHIQRMKYTLPDDEEVLANAHALCTHPLLLKEELQAVPATPRGSHLIVSLGDAVQQDSSGSLLSWDSLAEDTEFLEEVALALRNPVGGLECKTRSYMFKRYPNAFFGDEFVDWMIRNLSVGSRSDAVVLGHHLLAASYIRSVTESLTFKDKHTLYYIPS